GRHFAGLFFVSENNRLISLRGLLAKPCECALVSCRRDPIEGTVRVSIHLRQRLQLGEITGRVMVVAQSISAARS
ncbi:MAG: hypothetical protein ACJ8LN_01780, partial [Sulfurifustis sp.]